MKASGRNVVYTLWMSAFHTASYQYACKVMTALLHYFFLATFTWTLCEAVLIYILLVKVFGANDRKWIYLYLALGWGKLYYSYYSVIIISSISGCFSIELRNNGDKL